MIYQLTIHSFNEQYEKYILVISEMNDYPIHNMLLKYKTNL